LSISKMGIGAYTSLWHFAPNSGFEKSRNCTSTVANVVNLGGRSVW